MPAMYDLEIPVTVEWVTSSVGTNRGHSSLTIVLLLAGSLAACASGPSTTTQITVYDNDYRGTGDGRISLLWRRPAIPHQDIAIIEVTGRREATREDIVESMREHGIALGADAIVTNLHPDLVLAPVEFQSAATGIHTGRTEARLIGVAIRYCDAPLTDAAMARGCREFRPQYPDNTPTAAH